jgi:hypothetical protein
LKVAQEDYGTATCYFYVVGYSKASAYPTQPPYQQPYPSREEYLRQQQQDFQRIPV